MSEENLKDEAAYQQLRQEQAIWQQAKSAGVSRKRMLQMLATGAGAAAAVGGATLPRTAGAQGVPLNSDGDFDQYANWFLKPTPGEFFISHGHAREMRWNQMRDRGYYVPNELFYLQSHFPTPRIDADTYRLRVHGDGVTRDVEFTYDQLLAMPSTTVTRALECGENGRVFYAIQLRRQMDGAQWGFGAIGVAEWTGVALREVLERAGIKPTAVDVMPVGLDTPADHEHLSARPMPVSTAMADDTLLVYKMNGVTLPPDHGFPIRTLVSGWIGPANIKWTGSIEVSQTPLLSLYNTEYGVMVGPDYPPTPPSTLGVVATFQNVKSAFELPWPGALPAGPQRITGRSWSGRSTIARVEVSFDEGRTYQPARLLEPNLPQAWTRWEIDWSPRPGSYRLRARATDGLGNTQPDKEPYNLHGYLYGAVVDHPMTVF